MLRTFRKSLAAKLPHEVRSPLMRRSLRVETLEPRHLLAVTPGVYITEFAADNRDTLQDADSDSSDWLELFNSTGSAVNLDGWHLTDDSALLEKWDFPAVSIDAGSYLVVYASGKDRAVAGEELHTNFGISRSGGYLALVEPDGVTIASDYAYPGQIEDVSFGLPMSDFLPEAADDSGGGGQVSQLGQVPITGIQVLRDALQALVPPAGRNGTFSTNNRGDQNAAIDSSELTWSYLTPSGTQGPHLAALDLGSLQQVERLRVSKWGDTDGTTGGAPGLGSTDNMDLQILFTTDTGPLTGRTYLPVSGLTNGFSGTELINADAVNAADATVDNDHHDFNTDGWYSLSFDSIQATGIAVRFAKDAGDSTPWTHYRTNEFQVYGSSSLTLDGNVPIVGADQFPGPGGTDRDLGDAALLIDNSVSASSLLTQSGTDRTDGLQRVAVDLGTSTTVNRLRVFKDGDVDGNSVGDLEDIDPVDLTILYTTDTGPLDTRTYQPVSQLTRGYNGLEEIGATFVDFAAGTVSEDRHDSPSSGFFSLTFAPIAATGIAIEFFPSASDGNGLNNYKTREIQILNNPDAVLAADPEPRVLSPISDTSARFFERPTPGAINRSGPLGPPVGSQADSIVVFSEIMYHPAGDNPAQQWIELYNQMATDVDLAGWSVVGGVYYEFPRGAVIPGGGYLVVAVDPAALQSESGFAAALGPMAGNLSNGGQRIALRNNSGRIMESIDYDDTTPWPVGADGSGASLAKFDPNTSSGPAENWTHSDEVGGTPGEGNFAGSNVETVSETLLGSGAVATAFVPVDDTLDAVWFAPAFDDNAWLSGTSGVGYERGTGYDSLLGLDLDNPPNGQTPMTMFDVNSSVYVRIPFSVSGGLDRFGSLLLKMIYDDGFVAYLNGVEVARGNVPDLVAWNSASTANRPDGSATNFQQFDIGAFASLLTLGDNLLAIQGLNDGLVSSDLLILPEIEGRTIIPPAEVTTLDLAISEVAAGSDASFFVEIANTGDVPIDLAGFVLAAEGSASGEYLFPAGSIAAGQFVTVSAGQLGLTPADGDRLFLYGPSKQTVVDGRRVTGRLRGSSPQHDAEWLWPNISTPDAANSFDIEDSIVISEIMYHHAPRRADEAIPAEYNATEALDFGAVWRYNQSGADLGTNCANSTHAVDNVNWLSGAGPLGSLNLSGPLNNRGDQANAVDGNISTSSYLTPSGTAGPQAVAFDVGTAQAISRLRVSKWGDSDGTGSGTPGLGAIDSWDLQILYTTDTGPLNERAYLPVSGLTSGYQGSELIVADTVDPTNATVDNDRQDFASDGFYSLSFDAVAATGIAIRFERDSGDTASFTHYRVNEVELRDGASAPVSITGIDVFSVPEFPDLPSPIATNLDLGPTTYYFESDFVFSGDLADVDALGLTYAIDDGAVFYLNGQEILRTNMPTGPVGFQTQAASIIGDPSTRFEAVAPTGLQIGVNRLSVEVHQRDAGATPSLDVLMATKLDLLKQLSAGVPEQAFESIGEEWIEITNRGPVAVDLSGWQFDDAVDFTFPLGTMLNSGEILVVANDAAALATKFSGIRIVGDFSGSLSNRGERIVLRDANKNPADEVHYYPSGRWPSAADGGGSSLELRDLNADNSQPEAWAESDESDKSVWKSFSYRGIAQAGTGVNAWNEYVIGMLDGGELLLDDVSVLEDPSGAAIELIQNGTFESDTLGGEANTWRIIGNHSDTIVLDPEDAGNKVLHLTATSATKDTHNHGETTLVGNTVVKLGTEYEVSFRAKWISGSNQLNSRLFSNKLSETVLVPIPEANGTPGAENSQSESNVGPTFADVRHGPIVPSVGQPVTVEARIDDPDSVTSATLWVSVEGGAWTPEPMSAAAGGLYSATIGGQTSGAIVQFYVEATDGAGATSTFPAAGANSRALYQVQDGQDGLGGAKNFRLIITDADSALMLQDVNRMSNARMGATVVYNNQEVFYDVGARLKGSPFGRRGNASTNFNIRFNADQPFRGIHNTVIVDRSGLGTIGRSGQDEILTKQITNSAGDIPGMYDDIINFVDSQGTLSGGAMLQMARYDEVFLESQFGKNADNQSVYNYDVVHYLSSTTDGNPESPKLTTPSFRRQDIEDLGDDKDDYRWNFKLRNNRARDDFDSVMQMAKAWSLTGDALDKATQATMDVNEWMRKYAMVSLVGPADSYGNGSPHNLNLYVRPDDGKVIVMPWDLDGNFVLSTTRSLWSTQAENNNLRKIIELPANTRLFYGHLWDIINTTFNTDFMQRWTDQYGDLANENYDGILSYIGQRGSFVQSQLPDQIDFEISSGGGADFSVNGSSVTLQGDGWFDIREIYLAGNPTPLDVTWTDSDSWQATVSISPGQNDLQLRAFDFYDNLVGADSITVESTVSGRSLQEALRISEIHFNPNGSDDTEFVELVNTSPTETLDLSGARFVFVGSADNRDGIGYTFVGTQLAPDERVVVVKNQAAFAIAYPSAPVSAIAPGQYEGGLRNSGETLTLVDADGAVVQSFAYNDNWYSEQTDGGGRSLMIVDQDAPLENWSLKNGWAPSADLGGTPGSDGVFYADVNGDRAVGLTDLAILQNNLDVASGAIHAMGDLSGEGAVDRRDAVSLLGMFGRRFESPIPAAAPSQAAAVLTQAVSGHDVTSNRASHKMTSERLAVRHGQVQRNNSAVDLAIVNTQDFTADRFALRARRTRRSSALADHCRKFGVAGSKSLDQRVLRSRMEQG